MILKNTDNTLPKLDDAAAQQILANVFEASDQNPSQVPLELLVDYTVYRKDRYKLQRALVVLIMFVFCLLPFLFVAPKADLALESEGGNGYPTYSISVNSRMPVRLVRAVLDGKDIPVYEVGDHLYQTEPTKNGELEIIVTLWNEQSVTATEIVQGIDVEAPVLVDQVEENGDLCLYVTDNSSGINFSEVFGMTVDGFKFLPEGCDPSTGCIRIAIPTKSVNLFVPDNRGNTLQLVITVHEGN